MTARVEVIFVGPLPPPPHGMAIVNRHMTALIAAEANLVAMGVQPPALNRGLIYHLVKAKRALVALAGICRARMNGAKTFYGSVDDGWGGLWTTLFTAGARLLGLRIFLHHHSYRYVSRHRTMIQILTRVAGADASHIVLCDEMSKSFSALYPAARKMLVAPNSVDLPINLGPEKDQKLDGLGRRVLTIGLISNLTSEKGLRTFIEIVEDYKSSAFTLRGILAGPIPDAGDAEFVDRALERLAGKLTYRGPVYGEEKENVFRGMDVFVFPTTYETESFGLVLLEALIRRVPVIAPERGCICLFKELESATIIPLEKNFKVATFGMLDELACDISLINKRKSLAVRDGSTLNARYAKAQMDVVKMITASELPNGRGM